MAAGFMNFSAKSLCRVEVASTARRCWRRCAAPRPAYLEATGKGINECLAVLRAAAGRLARQNEPQRRNYFPSPSPHSLYSAAIPSFLNGRSY
jgi:hypothetical protein